MVDPTPHPRPPRPGDEFDNGTLDGLPPFPEGDDVDPPQANVSPSQHPWQLIGLFVLVAALLLLAAVVLA